MPKKAKLLAAGVFLALTGILCLSLLPNPSLAETDIFGLDGPFDGDGWSLSADKTLTIESNQGWRNAMKHGFSPNVNKLIIGKDLTDFRSPHRAETSRCALRPNPLENSRDSCQNR